MLMISKDDLLKELETTRRSYRVNGNNEAVYWCDEFRDMVMDDLPYEDVRPVKSGEWVEQSQNFVACTACGDVIHVKFRVARSCWRYCPRCGARITNFLDKAEGK